MSTLQSKRTLDFIWQKIANWATGGNGVIDSPFTSGPLVIDEALTLYVETTGNDAGNGTQASPFRTIQAALDYLSQFVIRASVVVQVGLGEFDGFEIPHLRIERGPLGLGGLYISGTFVPVASGTVTTAATGYINDSTKNWATDELKFCYAKAATSTRYWPVHSNTATQAKMLSNISPTVGSTYDVFSLGTVIVSNRRYTDLGAGSAGIVVSGATGHPTFVAGAVVLNRLRVTTTSSNFLVFCVANATATECTFEVSTGIGVTSYGPTQLSFNRCIFKITGATSFGISLVQGGQIVALSNSLFCGTSQSAQAGVVLASPNAAMNSFSACLYENLGIGVWCYPRGGASNNGSTMATFVGCTIGILVEAPWSCYFLDSASNLPGWPFASSGNGTLIKISGVPGNIRVSSLVPSGSATTDIDVNGATSTLAAMRALSPKVFPATPNIYGSYVYE